MITSGSNVGITQLVGRAIKKVKFKKKEEEEGEKTIAIGICKWGSIKDREEILGIKTAKSTAQVYYILVLNIKLFIYVCRKNSKQTQNLVLIMMMTIMIMMMIKKQKNGKKANLIQR